MAKIAFNDRRLHALKPQGTPVDFHDTKITGLSLRVQPSGKKTFYFLYRFTGQPLQRLKLGCYPSIALADAQELARQKRRLVELKHDPAAPVLKDVGVPSVMFQDLATEFIERHSKKNKKSWKQDVRTVNVELLPTWTNVPVTEITRRTVVNLLNRITDRGAPCTSDIVKVLLSRMFKFCISQGIVDLDNNPASGIDRARAPRKRKRSLDAEEVRRLWANWDEYTASGKPSVGEQFKLRLLTAQRGSDVLAMRWPDLDFDKAIWIEPFEFRKRRPTDSDRDPHVVPLAPMALEILKRLKDYRERELARKNAEFGGTWRGRENAWPRERVSDWVFPSAKGAGHLPNYFYRETVAMMKLAKVDDFNPHDLRRTASTWANATCRPDWVERLMDHEIGGVAGTYNQYAYLEHKTYVAYAIENKVREALGMPVIAMPPRPPA